MSRVKYFLKPKLANIRKQSKPESTTSRNARAKAAKEAKMRELRDMVREFHRANGIEMTDEAIAMIYS